MRSGPLIRTVHRLLTTSPRPITQGRVGGTASHAVNIFLLTQTLRRIGDTAPSLPHQPHRRMTSPPPAATQHHLHLSPRCCTTHHILLVGLPGSSKWPPPLHHLADSPESLNHAWLPVSPAPLTGRHLAHQRAFRQTAGSASLGRSTTR